MKILGKIIISGIIENLSPLLIGSGIDEQTDNDIILDSAGQPFIPATSVAGVIKNIFYQYFNEGELEKFKIFWGDNKTNQSQIDFYDLYIKKDEYKIEQRHGNRIDNKTGTAADQAKYDFQILSKNTQFDLHIVITVYNELEYCKKIAKTIASQLTSGNISFGAKTNLGLGNIKLLEPKISLLDFSKKEDLEKWLEIDFNEIGDGFEITNNNFSINANFNIKNSLIIREYTPEPHKADQSHLKSNNDNIISGTSLKGALRSRAEKILNTLDYSYEKENNETQNFIDALFGGVERDDNGKEKENGYAIPSRFIVSETKLNNVIDDEIQTRVKIDRFTGGTIESAIIHAKPVFPNKNETNKPEINNLIISIKEPLESEIGLAILLLKDLWTGDLAIGGEKSIGRGVLEGVSANLSFPNNKESIEINKDLQALETNKDDLQT